METKNATSLYDYIEKSVIDGRLPEDFSLARAIAGEDELVFADGAMDGCGIYHSYPPEPDEADCQMMTRALQYASSRDFDKADALFLKLAEKNRAIFTIKKLQACVADNKDKLKAGNIYEYALWLLHTSGDTECVKYGLSLLELFDTDFNESIRNEIRTVGLSDEFTFFSVLNMRYWKNGNDEIFRLAKKVHGWGRIHAIEYLEPTTDEIKSWLLKEAVHNDVMPTYSALTCWNHSGAERILMNHPTREEFAGIRNIIDALLDEGPVRGLSAIENGEEVITAFLDEAQRIGNDLASGLTLEDYEVINHIRSHYAEKAKKHEDAATAFLEKANMSGKDSVAPEDDEAAGMARSYLAEKKIVLTCRKILTTYKCWCVLIDSAKTGKGIEAATAAGIDCKPYIRDLMKSSFKDAYHLCGYLAQDETYRKELLEIYESRLPLAEMKRAPGLTLGFGEKYWRQRALEMLLQELRPYPFEGKAFVETGLQSEPIRTRNGALTVLRMWVEKSGKPLAEILPDFQALLTRLRDIEPDKAAKGRMNALIEGNVTFGKEF